MPSSPLWKLRRLAPRAKRVQARKAVVSSVIAAFGPTLILKADAFIATYDAAVRYKTSWRKDMREGKAAVAALVRVIHAWLPLVARDVPDCDASTFANNPDVPDDMLGCGERLLSAINDFTLPQGQALAYKADALAELEPALTVAQQGWAKADAADAVYQKLLKDAREAAAAFDVELQAFRRTLSTVSGRHDKDFQKLRAERASQADEADDEGEPSTTKSPPPPDA